MLLWVKPGLPPEQPRLRHRVDPDDQMQPEFVDLPVGEPEVPPQLQPAESPSLLVEVVVVGRMVKEVATVEDAPLPGPDEW